MEQRGMPSCRVYVSGTSGDLKVKLAQTLEFGSAAKSAWKVGLEEIWIRTSALINIPECGFWIIKKSWKFPRFVSKQAFRAETIDSVIERLSYGNELGWIVEPDGRITAHFKSAGIKILMTNELAWITGFRNVGSDIVNGLTSGYRYDLNICLAAISVGAQWTDKSMVNRDYQRLLHILSPPKGGGAGQSTLETWTFSNAPTVFLAGEVRQISELEVTLTDPRDGSMTKFMDGSPADVVGLSLSFHRSLID
jgi:hypothetical protein